MKIKRFFLRYKFNIIFSVLSIAFIIAVWFIAYYTIENEYVVPSFPDTMRAVARQFSDPVFWKAYFNTLWRTVLSFIISFAFALVLAVTGALLKPFGIFMRPIVALLRAVPTMVVIIILLIYTTPLKAPVIVTVLVLFPKLYATVAAALGDVDENLLTMAKAYRIGVAAEIFKIYLPQVAPNVLTQAGTDISFGLKLMVSAEVLSATAFSLGGMLHDADIYLRIPEFFALALIAVVSGFIVEAAVNFIASVAFRWRNNENSELA